MGSPRTGSASSEHSSSYQPSGLQYSQPLQYPTQFQAQIPFQVPQYSYDSYQPQTQVLDQSQYYVQPPTVPGTFHSLPSTESLMHMLQYILFRQVWLQERLRGRSGPGCDLSEPAKSHSETLCGTSRVSINNINARRWTQS
jgi:hypothetical protein